MLICLAMLLAGVLYFGWQAYTIYDGLKTITNRTVPRPTTEPTVVVPALNSNQRLNFLVLGSDNDRKKEEANPLTQSMIIVTVDPVHDKVAMLSIPRDFYVPIRGHGKQKIDLAYKYGKVQLARETVERLFHVPIDHYAWVGLDGFIRVIDTFRGVTLDADYPILDDSYPDDMNPGDPYGYRRIFIPAGWQHLDGHSALEYVRSRHGDYFGDFGRSHRQQQVLLALDRKANVLNVLQNLPSLVSDLRGSVQTDLSIQQLYDVEQIARRINPTNVQQVVLQVPTYSHAATGPGGQYIIVPDWNKIRPVVRKMFAPIVPAPTATPARAPSATASAGPSGTPATTPSAAATHPAPSATPKPTATPSPTPTPPSAHPSGRLVYVAGGNLWERFADGHTRQLTFTGDAAMPAVSPNRRSVAFVRFFPNFSDIWVLDLRTRRERAVTHGANPLGVAKPDVRNNLWAAWPQWSPDGKSIVFCWDHQKLSQPPSDARTTSLALWLVAANGSNPIQITTPALGAAGDTDPVWRPNSGQVLYVKWSTNPQTYQPYSQLQLYDTVTHGTWALTPVGGRVIQPSWSPGGRLVTFIRRDPDGVDRMVVARVLHTRSGPRLGPRTVLAAGKVAQPAFSPDGRWVSFLVPVGDGFQIEVVRSGGGLPASLSGPGTGVDARWRPVWIR